MPRLRCEQQGHVLCQCVSWSRCGVTPTHQATSSTTNTLWTLDPHICGHHRITIYLLLTCLIVTSVLATEYPPTLTEEPQPAVVQEGSKVVLHCGATGDSIIHWMFNGSNLTSAGLTDVTIQDGYLIIPSFRKSPTGGAPGHSGTYQCVATNHVGAVISREAKIESAYLGEFYQGFKDMFIEVTQGNVAFLPCAPPVGKPQPITSYELNGTEIDLNNGRYQVLPSGNLQIQSVHRRDNGDYRCVATNPITKERRRAAHVTHLSVVVPVTNQPPDFHWVPPSQVSATRGENLTLECVVEGAPVPVVTWSKYGGKLPANRHSQSLGNLFLYQVGKLDEGTYVCSANNGVGTAQVAIAQVDVLEPPLIQQSPASQTVTERSKVTFLCQGRGQPNVQTRWYHNGQEITGAERYVLTDVALTIRSARLQDSGVYQCLMGDSVGSVTAAAILTVHKQSSGAPSNQQEAMQGIAPDPQDHRPTQTSGQSAPNKSSPVDGATSSPDPPRESIIQISDRGGKRNRKKSRNSDNTNTQEAAVHHGIESLATGTDPGAMQIVPPSKPRVSKVLDTSVRLQWTVRSNSGLPITFFKVQYKELVSDKQRRRWRTIEADIPAQNRQFDVPGLTPGSTYRFRIVGVYSNNDNSHSPNSKKITLDGEDKPKVPVTPPLIVEAKTIDKSTIKLKWQYSPEHWTPVDGFHIYYRVYVSKEPYQKKIVTGSHRREAELRELLPNTMYGILMKVYNQAGESNFSNMVASGDECCTYPTNWPTIAPTTTTVTTGHRLDTAISTESSNKLLYIILGCVLGALVLCLLLFMGVCAWKQQQRARLLAAVEGRNKFHDPARTIHAQDSMQRKHLNGNGFLLNGINGHQQSFHNGHMPMYTYPRLTSDSPQGHHHHSNHHLATDDLADLRASLQEILQQPPPPPPLSDRGSDMDKSANDSEPDQPQLSDLGVSHSPPHPPPLHLYDNSPSHLYDNTPEKPSSCQNSLRSDSSVRRTPYRFHEPHLTDHIPRSHERLSVAPHPRGEKECLLQQPPGGSTYQHSRHKSASSQEDNCLVQDLNSESSPMIGCHGDCPAYDVAMVPTDSVDGHYLSSGESEESEPSDSQLTADVFQPGSLHIHEYSDEESLTGAPPSPLNLPRIPRSHDYPPTDIDD